MVLKKVIFIGLLSLFAVQLSAQELRFTDNYQTNFSQGSTNQLLIGSDVFRFYSNEQLTNCSNYLDSILVLENIEVTEINFDSVNMFSSNLQDISEEQALQFSKKWNFDYKADWQKMQLHLAEKALKTTDISQLNAIELLFFEMLQNEKEHFYNNNNLIANTKLTFLLTEKTTYFEKVQLPNLALARSSSYRYENPDISQTSCTDLQENEVEYSLVGCHTQSRLKDCLALEAYVLWANTNNQKIDFDLEYGINQSIIKAIIGSDSIVLFSFVENLDQIDESTFNLIKKQATTHISSSKHPFFYNTYDKKKIESTSNELSLDDFLSFTEKYLNDEHNICISQDRKDYKSVGKWLFDSSINYKKNSILFEEEADTILLDEMIAYLELNPSSSIQINGYAHDSEYHKIENQPLQDIIKTYENTHYEVGKVKLNLARALHIFDYMTQKGISPERIVCTGTIRYKEEQLSHSKMASFTIE